MIADENHIYGVLNTGLLTSLRAKGQLENIDVKRVCRFILALAGLTSSACSPSRPLPDTPSEVQADRSASHFRAVARSVYEALLTESCEADRTLSRAVVLARQRLAMRAFERDVRSAAASLHLKVAQGDIAYQRSSGTLGCWDDSDPRFAKMHVKMARQQAERGLSALRALAPGVERLDATSPDLGTPQGASFRALVRSVVTRLNPDCPINTLATNDEILSPARGELAIFKRSLEGTWHALNFAIAEADARYDMWASIAECSDPRAGPPSDATEQVLNETMLLIGQLAAAAGL